MDALKILLVEDDPTVRIICRKYFEAEGFEMIVAEDGLEGLNMARSEKPDIIVYDVMLPKMGGYTACKILKSDPRSKQIPIIIHTARMEDRDRELAKEAGADAFVVKTQIAELIEVVKSLAMEKGSSNG